MLQGFFTVMFIALGYGLVYLAYGHKGMELKKELGQSVTLPTVVSWFALIVWGLCLLFVGMESQDQIYCQIGSILIPVCYLIYFFYIRNWVKKTAVLWEEEKRRAAEERREKEVREREIRKAEEERRRKQEEIKAAAANNPAMAGDFVDAQIITNEKGSFLLCMNCGTEQQINRNICFRCGKRFAAKKTM